MPTYGRAVRRGDCCARPRPRFDCARRTLASLCAKDSEGDILASVCRRLRDELMLSRHFHRDLIFARAYYFAFMGGWGFVLPFVNLLCISLGLSGTQIGTIGSVNAIVGLIVSPIIVNEIKKRPQARGILQAALLGA